MPRQTPESRSDSLAQLNKLLEHRSRLGVCVLLADAEKIAFTGLKQLVKESDGNMGAHLRKLEDAGYISVDKRFEKRKPVSWYQLTGNGRSALQAHLEALQGLIEGLGGSKA